MKTKRRVWVYALALCAPIVLYHRTEPAVQNHLDNGELVTDLGAATLCSRVLSGINDNGQMVYARLHDGASATVLCVSLDGESVEVPALAIGNKINDSGQIAGVSYEGTHPQSVIWDRNFGLIPVTGTQERSFAVGINNQQQVVGVNLDKRGRFYGYFWSEVEGAIDLEQLIGTKISYAMAINDRQEIVGSAKINNHYRAFLWSKTRGLLHVGSDLTAEGSRANGINNRSIVVGHYRLDGQLRAFLWSEKWGFVDLNDLLPPDSNWEFSVAWDINDHGQIIGNGLYSGKGRNFLIQVIDEQGEPVLRAPSPRPAGHLRYRSKGAEGVQPPISMAGKFQLETACSTR